MRGPCMCGDTQCPSCGPAQGNWRCPICRAWADDGCEHIEEGGADLKPEFRAQAEESAKQEALAEESYARQMEEAEEYSRELESEAWAERYRQEMREEE